MCRYAHNRFRRHAYGSIGFTCCPPRHIARRSLLPGRRTRWRTLVSVLGTRNCSAPCDRDRVPRRHHCSPHWRSRMTTQSLSARHGFALLAVLWIIIALGVLAITVSRTTYRAFAGAQGEKDRVIGRWSAEGCIARLRSVSDAVLGDDPSRARERWQKLDSIVGADSASSLKGCDITIRLDGRPVLARATVAEL